MGTRGAQKAPPRARPNGKGTRGAQKAPPPAKNIKYWEPGLAAAWAPHLVAWMKDPDDWRVSVHGPKLPFLPELGSARAPSHGGKEKREEQSLGMGRCGHPPMVASGPADVTFSAISPSRMHFFCGPGDKVAKMSSPPTSTPPPGAEGPGAKRGQPRSKKCTPTPTQKAQLAYPQTAQPPRTQERA